ncbi:hypothetical protein CALCODRAFT_291023 [Calocera cornea HHB12733]|uniref:Uncharacterized protein n=1 Tax=Calocera cornea HHB12733 TaxID=1353952 RepID=A0A165FT90_9BASI|nr:hypothetical protein CALCODRAFT_291023 [Calocera cornea HHB12733]
MEEGGGRREAEEGERERRGCDLLPAWRPCRVVPCSVWVMLARVQSRSPALAAHSPPAAPTRTDRPRAGRQNAHLLPKTFNHAGFTRCRQYQAHTHRTIIQHNRPDTRTAVCEPQRIIPSDNVALLSMHSSLACRLTCTAPAARTTPITRPRDGDPDRTAFLRLQCAIRRS